MQEKWYRTDDKKKTIFQLARWIIEIENNPKYQFHEETTEIRLFFFRRALKISI